MATGSGDDFEQVDGVAGVGLAACGRRLRRSRSRSGRTVGAESAEQFGLQALANCAIRLPGDVGQHPAAELRGLTRDGQVGGDDYVGGVALVLELRGDDRGGGAVAPRLLALGLQHDPLGGRVLLLKRRNALVGHRDRADLDLDRAGELVAVDRQQGGAGQARRDALDVGEYLPGLGGRDRDPEFVVQLHG